MPFPLASNQNQGQVTTLPWSDPLAVARGLPGDLVLLYSSAQTNYSGTTSLLAWEPVEQIIGDSAAALDAALQRGDDAHWFGYLSYELGSPHTLPLSPVAMPRVWMSRFRHLLIFDHATQRVEYRGDAAPVDWRVLSPSEPAEAIGVRELSSSMSKDDYLRHAATVLEHIYAGRCYQANLTRKFHGTFTRAPDSLALFGRLCALSPAPYSAYLRCGERAVVSSSPECFLHFSADGIVTARPIKGTRPRSKNAGEDLAQRHALEHSEKDRAENLMITDLMRHDLAQSCVPGSVHTQQLFALHSHAQVHHLSSVVRGQLRKDCTPLECVLRCLPPGSMTGAPKVSAVALCAQLEGVERGVYSGVLGWFSGEGSAELSVVIRTLILHADRFEFQVGGGIVAESTPLQEWEETLMKARGICAALGISEAALRAL